MRNSIQAKAATSKRSTKSSARKLAKRLQGKESGKGVAIEGLTNIRFTSKRRNKKFRTKLDRWSFSQLRNYIAYKGLLYSVPVVVVDPVYTSQTCNVCKHMGKRTNKVFKCTNTNCAVDVMDVDFNTSKNISLLGSVVNQRKKSTMYSCCVHYSGLKPIPSLCLGG